MDPASIQPVEPKVRIRPIIIWLILLFLGFVFKVIHFPISNTTFVLSTGGLLGYTLHCMLNTKGKNTWVNILMGMNVVWIISLVCFELFNDGYPLNYRALIIYMIIGAIWFGGYRLAKMPRK